MDQNPEKPWWQPGLTVFAEVTGWIAAPIIGVLYLGKYMDNVFNSDPWYFLSLTGLAFVVSTVGITITAGKYISKIEKENKLTKDKSKIELDNKKNGSA